MSNPEADQINDEDLQAAGDFFDNLAKAEPLDMLWKVDTLALLHEIANGAMPKTMGVLKVPLNVFKNLLGQVATRAIQLDDPELNILMLRLKLYDTEHDKITQAIRLQQDRIQHGT